jgi:PilZ domain-containing protein
MAQFIVNPRRAPRAPAHCRVTVVCAAGTFEATTEDFGPRGCQLVAPGPLAKGDGLELTIASEGMPAPLRMPGVVAWASAQAPYRAGVAFDEALLSIATRWFEGLVAATPGLGTYQRVPDRIPSDASVYLGPPPRFLLDFTVEEAALLRAIGSGVRLDELQARMRADWPEAQRALFSLMARHLVTLARGQAAHPYAWKRILAEIEAALAVASLAGAAPASVTVSPPPPEPPPAPTPPPLSAPRQAPAPSSRAARPAPQPAADSRWGVPARDPHPLVELDEADAPALELAPSSPPSLEVMPFAADPGGRARAAPARGRKPEAQAAFERGLQEMEHGSATAAASLLRRALSLAPGDREIAEAIARLATRDSWDTRGRQR